jgi:hypothetical protein
VLSPSGVWRSQRFHDTADELLLSASESLEKDEGYRVNGVRNGWLMIQIQSCINLTPTDTERQRSPSVSRKG